MRRPKILVLITKADVGGAQIHVLDIMQGLQDHYEFILAVGEEDFLTRAAGKAGFEVHVLSDLIRPLSWRRDRLGYQQIRALLKQTQPDLLHVHSSKAGVLGRFAARAEGVPALFTAHGWAFTEGAHPLRRFYGWGIEFLLSFISRGVVTISEYDTQLARRLGVGMSLRQGQGKWLVRNCVAASRLSADIKTHKPAGKQAQAAKIISIGRLSPVKNQLLLLDALALLKQPFTALIIGEGEQRAAIEQKCRALALQDRVELLGEVKDCDKLLAEADVFVLSSNYEGLPLSVLEAMSAALPVVATDVGGVSEAVCDGETGYLVPRLDATALADKIDHLLTDAAQSVRMGQAGYARYQEQFELQNMLDGMHEVYDTLV